MLGLLPIAGVHAGPGHHGTAIPESEVHRGTEVELVVVRGTGKSEAAPFQGKVEIGVCYEGVSVHAEELRRLELGHATLKGLHHPQDRGGGLCAGELEHGEVVDVEVGPAAVLGMHKEVRGVLRMLCPHQREKLLCQVIGDIESLLGRFHLPVEEVLPANDAEPCTLGESGLAQILKECCGGRLASGLTDEAQRLVEL